MMNEKEKMISEELYKSSYQVLVDERLDTKEKLYDFNNTRPKDINKRDEILKSILGKIGNNCYIEQPFRCDYGYNIEIGNNFYSNYNLTILDPAKVKIGDNVLIGPNVGIYTAGHPIDVKTRNDGYEYGHSIEIGNNVWIGGNAIINPGVKIGNNTIIGSGSVVTKDIPDNVVAVGNPCRVIKEIDSF